MGNGPRLKQINSVFLVSAIAIVGIVILGIVAPKMVEKQAGIINGIMSDMFGWFYLISVLFIVLFCGGLAISKYGKVKLGHDNEKPQYSFFTWIGMLFSAGFGAGLVFWGVAEPMSHFSVPPVDVGTDAEKARVAMQYSFFNWGVHQWSVFTIVGLALAYFQFRKRKKGLISVTLDPLIGEKGKKPLRHTINTLAVITTVIGVATSLGMGVLQINGGLDYVFSIPQNTPNLLIITGILLALYLTSAVTGLDKGIKLLSTFNLALALGLMLVILFMGPTIFILQSLTAGVGDYIQNFFAMSLGLSPYTNSAWVKDWTIFYWAWVIAWSPFVGSFIARISRGRTIREFVFGVLIVPPAIAVIWIAIFGGTAANLELFQNAGLAEAVSNDVTSALFATFEFFPFSTLLSVIALVLIATFLVTSADSATFVLGMLTTDGNLNPSALVKVIWGVLMAAIVAVLLISSGLQGLQTASLIAALPFSIVLILMSASLIKSLKSDEQTSGVVIKENEDEIPPLQLEEKAQ